VNPFLSQALQLMMHIEASTLTAIASVISAFTALVAVICSQFLQAKIAKRQAADNISAKRQNWIDELRKDCAEYLALIARLEELRRPANELSEEDQQRNFDERVAAMLRGNELAIRIRLRLNPTEPDHIKLIDLFKSLYSICKDPLPRETPEQQKVALQAFSQERENILSHAQMVLKREWDRIKRGDV
jgi:seryl-tRNA synthetase